MGLTDSEVGLYTGWLALPWVIKPLWSPFIDLLKTKRWWVLTMQALIGAALAGIAFSIPTAFWFQATMCFFFLIAFCSATHDISADGFYMIELDGHNQTKYVGLRNTFYRLAIIFVNGVLVSLAGVLQVVFRNQIRFSWALIFYGLAGIFIALWLYHSRFMPRPADDVQTERSVGEVVHELKNMFGTFFQKFPVKETICVMLFLLLYRFPEALLNTMTKTFILRPNSQGGLGLSPQEYGFANGTVGLIGLLLGGIIGGILVSLPLFHLYGHFLSRPHASRHALGLSQGHGGLSPVLHHRHGVLHHHLRSHRLPQDRPRLRKERTPSPRCRGRRGRIRGSNSHKKRPP